VKDESAVAGTSGTRRLSIDESKVKEVEVSEASAAPENEERKAPNPNSDKSDKTAPNPNHVDGDLTAPNPNHAEGEVRAPNPNSDGDRAAPNPNH
jgi:hypothetical protein